MKTLTWMPAFAGMTILAAGAAFGADYYIYKDGAGRTVIGNQTSPASAEILKRYDWPDATDAEIAQTAQENRAIAAANLERDRIAATEKLAAAIAERNAIERPGLRIEINEASVSTSQIVQRPGFSVRRLAPDARQRTPNVIRARR